MSFRVHAPICLFVSGSTPGRRRAFSLIELMVAIVILGLGMVMVATIFPIAWGQARRLSEATSRASITEAAKTTIEMLARVDRITPPNAGSFAGDLVFDEKAGKIVALGDTRVHLLYMENLLVSPRAFVPDRMVPWYGDNSSTGDWIERPAPWQLERKPLLPSNLQEPWRGDINAAVVCGTVLTSTTPDYCSSTFLSPQVRFDQRVHPPMRSRGNVDPTGLFIGEGAQWDAALNTRRYAWAIFHRVPADLWPDLDLPDDQDGIVGPIEFRNYPDPDQAEKLAAEEVGLDRRFDVYYVTLRRPQSTLRYARQEPSTAPNPYALSEAPEVVPAAQPATEDVVLPEPWRVQIWVHSRWPPSLDPTGIPAEIQVPPEDIDEAGASDASQAMLAQMFQRGTQFIDEITGQVYRVIKHRLSDNGLKAFLTLDQEMTFDDVNLANVNPGAPPSLCPRDCFSDAADPEERLRTVWVFPPPVQATRLGEGIPIFEGPQPVVGIEIYPLSISPGR